MRIAVVYQLGYTLGRPGIKRLVVYDDGNGRIDSDGVTCGSITSWAAC